MSGTIPVAEGITNPPIDELLEKTDSKYKLVLYPPSGPAQRLLLTAR